MTTPGQVVSAAGSIEIGNHWTVTVAGMTLNIDTIYSTVIAGAIVIGLALFRLITLVMTGIPLLKELKA